MRLRSTKPIPFTSCLAAAFTTTLVRPSESFVSAFFSATHLGVGGGRLSSLTPLGSSFTPPRYTRPAKTGWRARLAPEWANNNNVATSMRSLHNMAASGESSSPSEKSLFLFDFDGVVCDSCDECTVSALRTCKILNALIVDSSSSEGSDNDEDTPPAWLFDKMREIRPAIEVGWQIPVLLSVFLEQRANATPDNPAMTVPEIIGSYEHLVENWLSAHDLKDSDMVQTFGKVRDDWIANDLNSWLDINTFYNGISDGITNCVGETVLVTTKQHRFATALVRHAGVEETAMPDDSIYGLGMYKSKSDVIVDRMQSGEYKASNTHFFEDRWPTIAKCLKDDRLENVNFYLCSWGYCTEEELKLAESEPRVQVLQLEDFSKVVTL